MLNFEQFKSLEEYGFKLHRVNKTYIFGLYREFIVHISTDEKVICFMCENHGHNVGVEYIDINQDEIEQAIKNCIETFDI